MKRCRSCQALIRWAETASGRPMPLNYHPDPNGNVQVDAAGKAIVYGTEIARRQREDGHALPEPPRHLPRRRPPPDREKESPDSGRLKLTHPPPHGKVQLCSSPATGPTAKRTTQPTRKRLETHRPGSGTAAQKPPPTEEPT